MLEIVSKYPIVFYALLQVIFDSVEHTWKFKKQ